MNDGTGNCTSGDKTEIKILNVYTFDLAILLLEIIM